MNLLTFLEQEREKLKALEERQTQSSIRVKDVSDILLNASKETSFIRRDQSSMNFMVDTAKHYEVKTKLIKFKNDYIQRDKSDYDIYLHIFIDKTMDQKLKTEKLMREYQRLMLASVAHEFRNPLNSIMGNLDLIGMISDQERVKKFVDIAKNSGSMLNSYVDDILDLGRIEGGGFQLNPIRFHVG